TPTRTRRPARRERREPPPDRARSHPVPARERFVIPCRRPAPSMFRSLVLPAMPEALRAFLPSRRQSARYLWQSRFGLHATKLLAETACARLLNLIFRAPPPSFGVHARRFAAPVQGAREYRAPGNVSKPVCGLTLVSQLPTIQRIT